MNKTELAEKIAEKAGLSKTDAAKALNAAIESIEEAVVAGDQVQLIGFGTFKVSERSARTGRNPLTGETLKIAASKSPKFQPGKAFKEACNAKKSSKKK